MAKHQYVRGVVTKEGSDPGQPLPGLSVVLGTRRAGRFLSLLQAETDADGEFSFDLGRLPQRGSRPTRFELRVVSTQDRAPLEVHGTTAWTAGIDPGVLRLCATPPEACAAPTESVPDPVGGDANRVFGRVRHTDGTAVADVTVELRTLTLTGETADVSATTDADGWYQMVPSDPDADFILKVLRPATLPAMPELIGTSRAVYTPSLPERVDVDVDDDRYRIPSEFTRLTATLTPALGGTDPATVGLRGAATLSGKTSTPLEGVSLWVAAHVLGASLGASAELLYGLFRVGFPTTPEALLARPRGGVPATLHVAVDRNLISTDALDGLDDFVEALAVAHRTLLAGSRNDVLGPILHASGLLSNDQVTSFVDAYVRHEGNEADFWTHLPELSYFDGPSAAEAKRLMQVAVVAHCWAPAVHSILATIGTSEASTVADLSSADWTSIVSSSNLPDLPDGLDGATEEERRVNFATLMAGHSEVLHASRAARTRVLADIPDDHPLIGAKAFLLAHPAFDLATSRVVSFSGSDTELAHTQALQRLYRVSPTSGRGTAMLALGAAGFRSAHDVARRGQARLATDLADALATDAIPTIFRKARKLYAITLTAYQGIRSAAASKKFLFVPTGRDWSGADFPDYESMFGNIDYCECIDCRSILGPSAYLVWLLNWLGDHAASSGGTLRDALVGTIDDSGDITGGRRPDLAALSLSCENTDRTLPYIDLVLEVLENAVKNTDPSLPSPSEAVTSDAAHDSEAEPPAMLASPQYVDATAYTLLADASTVFGFGLPFRQPLEEARTFLGFLGVPRPSLLATFAAFGATTSAVTSDDIAVEELGLYDATFEAIYNLYTDDPELEAGYWPVPGADWKSSLAEVSGLTRAAQLTWPDVLDLLHTRYINPVVDGARDLLVGTTDPCDLDDYTITSTSSGTPSATAWARFRQFIRLQRTTGWTALDLDKVLGALGISGLETSPTTWAAMLADLHALSRTTHLGPVELADWHTAKMDHWSDRSSKEDPVLSLYEQVYLSPSVLPADDARRADFQIDEGTDDVAGAGTADLGVRRPGVPASPSRRLGVGGPRVARPAGSDDGP